MKPPASISLDLDNLWAYMRAHGVPGWQDYPTYIPLVVPMIIKAMRTLDLKLTVFVVGRDADIAENYGSLVSLVQAGHEIGNHSYQHEPWMHHYSKDEMEREIDKAHIAIMRATGIEPRAFRGPGFSVSNELLRHVSRKGYRYDASLLPTIIGPLIRAAYFRSADLTPCERQKRAKQFGSIWDGLRPIKPFIWTIDDHELLEVPVTTIPVIRIPIHLTYIHYLAQLSPRLARLYFCFGLQVCRLFKVAPSLLLHPLDFLASDALPELGRFPGIGKHSETKRELTMSCLRSFKASFDIKSLNEFVEAISNEPSRSLKKIRSVTAP